MAGKDPLFRGGLCDRARHWTSLRLDDELSPLEAKLLDRHLEACDDCRLFAEDVRWATDVLRLTPQERPARRITLPAPARRRATGHRLSAAAAAALAVGALLGALVESPSSQGPPDGPTEVSLLDRDELRDLPRTRLLEPQPATTEDPSPPEGVI
jgi:ferric-dicitrate binding protein FerR (iron transport regulator)